MDYLWVVCVVREVRAACSGHGACGLPMGIV